MKKIIWIPLALAATATALITALPFAIEHLAERWLRDQAVPDPAIEDVDFNPFTGLLRIESAVFSGPGNERGELDLVEVDLSWGALFRGQIEVSRFTVSGGRLDVRKLDDGRLAIGGLTLPLAPTPSEPQLDDAASEPWGLGLSDASVQGIDIGYRDDRFDSKLLLRRLALDRIATWAPDAATRVSAELELDGVPIALWAQTTPLSREPEAELTLKLERLSLGAYPVIVEAAKLTRAQGLLSLDLNSTLRYGRDGALVANVAGSAGIDEAEIEQPGFAISGSRLEWTGEFSATVPANASVVPDLSGTGSLSLTGLALHRDDGAMRLAAFERLDATDLTVHAIDHLRIGQVRLRGLQMLRQRGVEIDVGSIAQTEIETIEITAGLSLAIGRASLTDVIFELVRTADGRLDIVSELVSDFAPAPAGDADEQSPAGVPSESTESSEAAFGFSLGTLEIGGDSVVRFQDNAVTPPLASTLSIKRLRLTGIDSRAPDQPLRIEFDIQQADGATLTGAGDVRPFGEQLGSDLEIALARLDLSQLSSYLPGYNIQRGRLELDSRARLEGDTLEVSNSLVIDGLKLSGKAAGEQSLLGEGMAMPLDVALDLLRDGDGKIKLELPVSGSLSDPQFGTGDIIRTAMQNALQKAALSYVKNALQPLGTILMVAKVAGKAARPRFEPVAFESAATELTPEAQSYLDKIGQLMAERPGLRITLCGVSTLADRDYLIEASKPAEIEPVPPAAEATGEAPASAPLEIVSNEPQAPPPSFEAERLELARERGAAIQRYLVSAKGIDAERLFSCRPTLEDETGPPRVEITL